MSYRGQRALFGYSYAAVMAVCLAATPSSAAAQVRNFDISSGDLATALNAFAHQANQEIIFPSSLVAGKQTKGVHGSWEPRAALQTLLQGTGLRIDGNTVLYLRKVEHADPAAIRHQTVSYDSDSHGPIAPGRDDPQTIAAAPAPSAETVSEPVGQDVVVTGSRITRRGFEAPTPTTVVSMEDIQARAPTNVADYVNQLPSMGLGTSPRTTTLSATTSGGGSNELNMRGLGATRTLVLLDGRRMVSDGLNSTVDINLLPQNLVERVDVVTGGASAAYGSDAVAGVVNFILDTKFTGLKGSASYGETEHGDAQTFTADLAFGAKFAGGRGHILLSGSYFNGQGVDSPLSRTWYQPGYRLIPNPDWTATNGQPGQIVRYDVGYGHATPGGLITSGPLRGTTFGPNGQIGQFIFGPIQNGDLQAGGTVEDTAYIWPLLPTDKHWSTYGRLSYEVTNDITATVEGGWAGSNAVNWSSPYARQANITITSDNPYLPALIKQEMTADDVTSFTMGRLNYDLVNGPGQHGGQAGYNRRQGRILAALNGTFFGKGKWEAYYQHGHSDVTYTRSNNIIPARFNEAIDVVANPTVGGVPDVAAGTPVCRSTIADPTNGCIPMNLFGVGAPSAASISWATGNNEGLYARQDLSINQDVAAIDGQYEPFSTWAGPVSIAAGFEYRHESFVATADPLSLQGAWFTGNFGASSGHYNVKEVFGEVLVPLLKDAPLVKSLDFDGAVRRTDYSTSGAVTTWKTSLSWQVNDDLRLRGTRSQDIRAPNLSDLFAAGTVYQNNYIDPSQPGSPSVSTFQVSGGNPNLKPEVATTWTAGGVYRPHWLPGFSVSVDWYKIDIKGAIVSLDAQTLINQCYGAGVPQVEASCAAIVKAPGRNDLLNAYIYTGGINAQNLAVEGIDYEVDYRASLDRFASGLPGAIDLRLLASDKLKDQTLLGGSITDQLDLSGHLKWTGIFTGTYSLGPSRTTLTTRYLGSGKVSNYPSTSQQGLADNLNHFGAVWYFDIAENYDLNIGGHQVTLFGVIENMFDRDPEYIPGSYAGFGTTTQYDLLGRTFRAGMRFKF